MNSYKSKAIAIGTTFGAISCVLLLMIFAVSFVKMEKLPHDIIGAIVIFCAAVGSFFSGYISLRILRENGLLYGTISGFILFLVLLIASALVSGEHLTLFTVYKGMSMVIAGALGGLISVNKRTRV